LIDLRKHARETDVGCQIRIPEICNWSPTCLCHIRRGHTGGMGLKPPDILGVIGCQACHDWIDGRNIAAFVDVNKRLFEYDALIRTLEHYHKEGILE